MKVSQLIDEEKIASLKFPEREVLTGKTNIEKRLWRIQKAIELGVMFNEKIEVRFKDGEGVKAAHTVITAIENDKIILKHGAALPICRVLDVVIF